MITHLRIEMAAPMLPGMFKDNRLIFEKFIDRLLWKNENSVSISPCNDT